MYEFIVLGLIPGTQYQITFGFWVTLVGSIVALILLHAIQRRNIVRNYIVTFGVIFILTRRRHLA